jgi:DNA end-binding protein Ku
MPMRTSWEGYLKVSLISVPVKAYSAAVSGRGQIGFHLLHSKCHSRIRYKKVCPIHGEVPNDEIVSGYEHAKDQYVVVKKEDLAKLKPDADKTIEVDVFIDPDELDPVYFSDRSYYLVPDGRVAAKSYAVLHRVMSDERRLAVGTMIFSGKEHIVCLRATGKLFAVTFLSFADTIKKAADFEDEVPDAEVPPKELELARGLLEATTVKDFDLSQYKDKYAGKVMKMLESKAGKHGVKRSPAAEHEPPAVINLMDALRESLRKAGRRGRASRRVVRRKTG